MTTTHVKSGPADGRPAAVAALIVAVLAAFRLALAPQAGLVTDEAHYALYGLRLDWSYFDHPPLVGWLQATALSFSSSELALRLWPIALSVLSCVLLFRLVPRLFPDESPWTATVAVALWASAPIVIGTGLALVPESVLVPLALLVAHATVSVLRWGSLREWLLLGVVLGLAGLAKYTAVTLAATVALSLLLAGRVRDLRTAGPWLALLVAAAIVSPVVIWNAAHDWVSIRYQIHHGTGGRGWSVLDFLRSRAGEFLLFGPALTIAGAIAAWQALRRERAHPGVRLLLLLAAPVVLVFWPASGHQTTLPHWMELAWLALAVLAARWYVAGWARSSRRVLAAIGALWCGSLLVLVALVATGSSFEAQLLHGARAQLVGWPQAAQMALRLRDDMGARPGSKPLIFTDHWTHASRLAWYGRPATVQVLDGRFDQFDLWFGSPSPGERGVLVAWDEDKPPDPQEDLAHFAHHELLAELPIEEHGVRLATFRFWACDDWEP
jgi:4-amino-4-deoxy-L-arabinose transferase-like glycosyltransferase